MTSLYEIPSRPQPTQPSLRFRTPGFSVRTVGHMGSYTDYTLTRPTSVAELRQLISERTKIPALQLVLLQGNSELHADTLIAEATTLSVLINLKRN